MHCERTLEHINAQVTGVADLNRMMKDPKYIIIWSSYWFHMISVR